MKLSVCTHLSRYDRYFSNGISSTVLFLEHFSRNLLFRESNKLSDCEMHIAFVQSANPISQKSLNGTLNCTLAEISLLKFLKANPSATQADIAGHLGKSERTIKRMTPSLTGRGLLKRENGKRNGNISPSLLQDYLHS